MRAFPVLAAVQPGRLAVAIGGPPQHSGGVPSLGVVAMLTVLTRAVLLRLGRSAMGSTVKASELDDPEFPAAAEQVFDRMAAEVEWPNQMANQVYLVEMVLPVAAVYTALREQSWDQPEAIRTVHHAFLATGNAQRQLFILLMRTRLGAGLFLRTLRPRFSLGVDEDDRTRYWSKASPVNTGTPRSPRVVDLHDSTATTPLHADGRSMDDRGRAGQAGRGSSREVAPDEPDLRPWV